mgnify:FL=1
MSNKPFSALFSADSPSLPLQNVFYLFGGMVLLCIALALLTNHIYFLTMPFGVLFVAWLIRDFRAVYFALLFFLPLSIEHSFGEFLATDLPTEPLMIILMCVAIGTYLAKPPPHIKNILFHPIMVLLLLHLVWIAISVVYSQNFWVSVKYFSAKIWYVSVFVGMSLLLLRSVKHYKTAFWCIYIPLTFVVIQTLVRHYYADFDFVRANVVMLPFFRNHVNYAMMLAIFYPFLWSARHWYPVGSFKRYCIGFGIVLYMVAMFYSYTRAAYVSILILPIVYGILHYRFTSYIVTLTAVVLMVAGVYYGTDNRYMELAPNFERTIYHENLGDHLSATFAGTDVSFMERVYRWVAAVNMSQEHPIVGFGPANFYNFYRYYTITSFKTYVSDNPEKSGVHNYFLMTLVEQGLVGLIIMLVLCAVFFLQGEQIYQRQKSQADKSLVMCVLLSQFIIVVNMTISDLIEVDKIGSLFFINFALLINLDLAARSILPTTTEQTPAWYD